MAEEYTLARGYLDSFLKESIILRFMILLADIITSNRIVKMSKMKKCGVVEQTTPILMSVFYKIFM